MVKQSTVDVILELEAQPVVVFNHGYSTSEIEQFKRNAPAPSAADSRSSVTKQAAEADFVLPQEVRFGVGEGRLRRE